MEIKIENGIAEAFVDCDEIEIVTIFSIACPRCGEKIEERSFEAMLGDRQHDCGMYFFVS